MNTLLGAWVARVLGPGQLGELVWGAALGSLFFILAGLGVDLISVRLLTRDPDQESEILGTVIGLKAVGATLSATLMAITLAVAEAPTERAMLVAWMSVAALLLSPMMSPTLWFQAHYRLGEVARMRLVVNLLSVGARATALVACPSVLLLGAIGLIEAFVVGVVLLRAFGRAQPQSVRLSFSRPRAREILRLSWPELISGISVIIYLKIDQVMLGKMVGTAALGEYGAVTRLLESVYVVPVIVTGAIAPALFRAWLDDKDHYGRLAQRLHDVMFVGSVAVALGLMLGAEWVCGVMFGHGFVEAPSILAIQAWSLVPVAMNVSTGKLIHAEGLVGPAVYRQVLGAAANVGLNLALIPRWGPQGAAIATLAAYWLSCYLGLFLSRRVRHFAGYVTRSMTGGAVRLTREALALLR